MHVAPYLAALLLACGGTGHAALGGLPESFNSADARAVTGVSVTAPNYVRRETTLPSGTLVREYISVTGIVFAVAWEGPVLPDLKSLLGKYFETLVAESTKAPKAGRSSVAIEQQGVFIYSGGRMRAFEGAAWIPAQLPAGFRADDVR